MNWTVRSCVVSRTTTFTAVVTFAVSFQDLCFKCILIFLHHFRSPATAAATVSIAGATVLHRLYLLCNVFSLLFHFFLLLCMVFYSFSIPFHRFSVEFLIFSASFLTSSDKVFILLASFFALSIISFAFSTSCFIFGR